MSMIPDDPFRVPIVSFGPPRKEPNDELFIEKAGYDQFDYAVWMRGGRVIRCSLVEDIGGGWVRLHPHEGDAITDEYPCPRGIDVRADLIEMIADAPEGS